MASTPVRVIALCVYQQDPSKTLHCEGLPELTVCGLAFTPFAGALPGVLVDQEELGYEPKCQVCFPNGKLFAD